MSEEKKNFFVCGYCAYTQMIDVPTEKKDTHLKRRGFCRFNPPAVFPMPTQKTAKIAAMGQQPPIDIQPYMMRPVVNEDEPMCGQWQPNVEAAEALGLTGGQGGCGGCNDEGAKCGCK